VGRGPGIPFPGAWQRGSPLLSSTLAPSGVLVDQPEPRFFYLPNRESRDGRKRKSQSTNIKRKRVAPVGTEVQQRNLVPMGPYPIACDKGGQRDGAKQPFKTIAGKIIGLGETDPIESKDNHGSSERG